MVRPVWVGVRRFLTARPRLLAPRKDEVLDLHPEAVCDPRYVVEVGDYLGSVVDRGVVEPVGSEPIQIGGRHLLLSVRELFGELAQGPIGRGEVRLPPVPRYVVNVPIGFLYGLELLGDLGPEVVRVRLRSVAAVDLGRDHRGQQLALSPRER